MLILLLDDIKIINFLHVNFFINFTYYFYRNISSSFKTRSFRELIKKGNLYSVKLKKIENNNNKFLSNKISFLYNHEEKSTQYFIKILKKIKCLVFFRVIKKIN